MKNPSAILACVGMLIALPCSAQLSPPMTAYKNGKFHTSAGKRFFTETATSTVYLVVCPPENSPLASKKEKASESSSLRWGGLFKILCSPLSRSTKQDVAEYKSIYLVGVLNSMRE
jgi:hypothetical protein